MNRRRLLGNIIGLSATIGIAPILSACGAAPAPAAAPAKATEAPKAAEAPKPTVAAAQPAPAKGSVELVYLNQSRGQAKAMDMLAEKYTKEQGIKVTVDSPGPVDYPKKLQASSQANTMPDMFYGLGAGDMAPYYKAGLALNLKPEMDKGWKKNFTPIILDLAEFREGNSVGVPPGIYTAPWEGNSYGVLYNPALLEKAKLDPKKLPATTTEWLEIMKAQKAAKVGAFICAAEFIPTFIQTYVSNYLTDEEIDATQAGKSPWKSDAYRKALQFFADVRDAGAVFNTSLGQVNAECEKSFFNVQEVSFIYTGVFSVPVQVTTAPDFKAYSSIALPKAPDGKSAPRSFGAGGKNGVVHAKGKNVDASLTYIKWLTEKEQEAVMMEVVPLVPTNPAAVDQTKILPALKVFAAELERIQKVPSPRSAQVNEAQTKGVQSLLLKEKGIDQILDEIDKAQKG